MRRFVLGQGLSIFDQVLVIQIDPPRRCFVGLITVTARDFRLVLQGDHAVSCYYLVERYTGDGLVGRIVQLKTRKLLLALRKRIPVSQSLRHLSIDPKVRFALKQRIEHFLLQEHMSA